MKLIKQYLISLVVALFILCQTTNTQARAVREKKVGIGRLWKRARKIRNDVQTLIPGWYDYVYDGPDEFGVNRINYGGPLLNPMYLTGNMVRFYKGDNPTLFTLPIWYNSKGRKLDYDVKLGGSWHPFMALSWIRNPTEDFQKYTFQINGYVFPSDDKTLMSGSGNLTSINGRVSVQYHYFHIYGGGDPAVCEVYALISSQTWGSKLRSRFFVHNFSSSIGELENSVRLQGNPKNVLMSYILLSKSNGGQITQVEIERFLNRLTQYVTREIMRSVTTTVPITTTTTTTTTISITTTPITTFTTSTEENHGCVHFLTATKFAQYIRSPGWPKRSPRGLNCYWHIKGPPGSQISTFLDSFHVDPSNSLNFIEKGRAERSVSGLYTIWNHQRLRTFISSGSLLTLNYKTPSSYYSSEFQLQYKAIGDFEEEKKEGCPDWSYKATSIPQHIQSPNYPNNYPDNLKETYYICGPEGSQIFVQLIHFDTEACCDYLQYIINDRQVRSIKGMNRVRGTPWLQNYTSPGSNLTLRFITNFIGSAWGFDLTYQAIGDFVEPPTIAAGTTSEPTSTQPQPARCGDRLTATSTPQPIKSPGWPTYYPRDLGCSWYIYAPDGFQILLDFSFVDTERYDYITISDGNRRFRQMRGRSVIRNNPSLKTFTSPGSKVIVSFITDSIGASYGFELTYQVEEVTPGCETPPLRENGIVACVDPREDGRWELGDVCDYICPEGSKLVGAEQAECQVIDDFAFFGPDHPCCEPDCDPNQPTDILFVLDHSTSITAARWPIITSFANSIIEAFDMETVHFGVVVYGRGVLSELNIPFDFTNDKNILTAAVTAIPYDNPLPGTFTVEALNFARTDGFSAAFGDRVNARNLVIFVSDGVSFDLVDIGNGLTTLDLAADFLHGVADVFSVGVGNFNLDELLTIASNDDFVATTTDFGKLNDLIDDVTTIACPVQCPV